MYQRSFLTVKVLFLLLMSFLVFSPVVSAWEQFGYVSQPLDGMINLTNLITNSAPLPLTRYDEGDWKLVVKPIYFTVDTLHDQLAEGGGIVRGDDLSGTGGSVLFSRALNDRWQFYGLISFSNMDGKVISKMRPSRLGGSSDVPTDVFEMEGKNSAYLLNAGFGYELTNNKNDKGWSVPVFFGFLMQSYDSSMKLVPLPEGPQQFLDIEGSGTIQGFSFGIAGARTLGRYFEIVPYLLDGELFSRPKLKATVTRDGDGGGSLDQTGNTASGESGGNSTTVLGLILTYRPWGLSLSIGGLLTSAYSKEMFDGLETTRFSISKSFGNYRR